LVGTDPVRLGPVLDRLFTGEWPTGGIPPLWDSTDLEAMLADPAINRVAIVTGHNLHASFVVKSLAGGKQAFVEKPLCLTLEALGAIEDAV
jgi:predicted dehydrogenase